MTKPEVVAKIREILFTHFIQNVKSSDVPDNHELISTGLLDSINVLRLVDKLEQAFGVEFKAHEVDKDNLNSVDIIAGFILKKKGS
ncbi:MAG: acyl carrier protein [Flavobacteriales bacterium]